MQDHTKIPGLTTIEISNIWSAYQKNSIEYCFLKHFFLTLEDRAIKEIIGRMADQSKRNLEELTALFNKERHQLPLGFTEDDVDLDAGKVFSDPFIAYFCHDLTMLSLITYTSALSDCTRKDVRSFFQTNAEQAMQFQNDLTEIMLSQGTYLKSPQLEIDAGVDFAGTVNYLSGIFHHSRALNVAEIANLTRLIHRAQFSKMVFVAFSKLAENEDVKKYFSKGRDALEKILDSLQEVLDKENIQLASSGDLQFMEAEPSPFSDKLMMFFTATCLGMFCFVMVSQALTSSLRTDITYKLNKMAKDMEIYYGKGLLLLISEKWLEKPPQAVDRKV